MLQDCSKLNIHILWSWIAFSLFILINYKSWIFVQAKFMGKSSKVDEVDITQEELDKQVILEEIIRLSNLSQKQMKIIW